MERDIQLRMRHLDFHEKGESLCFPSTHSTPPAPSRILRKAATSRCLRFIKFPLSNANVGFSPGAPLIGLKLPDI
ncbi:hypothetical protein CEXT_668761 [Caerostris extrusa]|uniref:Uncharacterized protein n=1 Tax=Caerostris extrusa TaxID=172846 RepID=A0AAV4XAZ9_CAEEX|nr:hypothetical protein CEXT_668761 [Caerostris extrusa]